MTSIAGLIVFGLAGGRLVQAARDNGLAVAQEVFADRSYQPDGTLTPRSDPDALISDPERGRGAHGASGDGGDD